MIALHDFDKLATQSILLFASGGLSNKKGGRFHLGRFLEWGVTFVLLINNMVTTRPMIYLPGSAYLKRRLSTNSVGN